MFLARLCRGNVICRQVHRLHRHSSRLYVGDRNMVIRRLPSRLLWRAHQRHSVGRLDSVVHRSARAPDGAAVGGQCVDDDNHRECVAVSCGTLRVVGGRERKLPLLDQGRRRVFPQEGSRICYRCVQFRLTDRCIARSVHHPLDSSSLRMGDGVSAHRSLGLRVDGRVGVCLQGAAQESPCQ